MTQIQTAIQQGLKSLRTASLNIQKLGTYRSTATPSYDPTTGTITSPGTNYANVPMVFTSFRRIEIDGDVVRAEDQKVIIATADLTAVPTVNDTITKADGTTWNVLSVTIDPADAAWVLQVRKP